MLYDCREIVEVDNTGKGSGIQRPRVILTGVPCHITALYGLVARHGSKKENRLPSRY